MLLGNIKYITLIQHEISSAKNELENNAWKKITNKKMPSLFLFGKHLFLFIGPWFQQVATQPTGVSLILAKSKYSTNLDFP